MERGGRCCTGEPPAENAHQVKVGTTGCIDEDTLDWEESAAFITLGRSVGGGAMEETSCSDLTATRTYRSEVIKRGWATNDNLFPVIVTTLKYVAVL